MEIVTGAHYGYHNHHQDHHSHQMAIPRKQHYRKPDGGLASPSASICHLCHHQPRSHLQMEKFSSLVPFEGMKSQHIHLHPF